MPGTQEAGLGDCSPQGGAPRGVGHPRVEALSPRVFEWMKGRGDGVITTSFPWVGGACVEEPCQGEEAVSLDRNVGRVGEVPQAFQRGRDTR